MLSFPRPDGMYNPSSQFWDYLVFPLPVGHTPQRKAPRSERSHMPEPSRLWRIPKKPCCKSVEEKRECQCQRDWQGEEARKRSDKTDSGELKLICFFDDSRTPTVISRALSIGISLPSITIQILSCPFISQSASYLFRSLFPKFLISFPFHPTQIVASCPPPFLCLWCSFISQVLIHFPC